MAVPFVNIEAKFDRVFGFLQRDLERTLTLDPGVNYAAAMLIACACETLAYYRYNSKEGADSFSLLLPPGDFRTVAKKLYDALRNGLVHNYDAKDIQFKGKTLQLAIAWEEHKHLSIIDIDGVPNLVLNVHQLCADLSNAFREYRAELECSSQARDQFLTQWRQGRTLEIHSLNEIDAWESLLKNH